MIILVNAPYAWGDEGSAADYLDMGYGKMDFQIIFPEQFMTKFKLITATICTIFLVGCTQDSLVNDNSNNSSQKSNIYTSQDYGISFGIPAGINITESQSSTESLLSVCVYKGQDKSNPNNWTGCSGVPENYDIVRSIYSKYLFSSNDDVSLGMEVFHNEDQLTIEKFNDLYLIPASGISPLGIDMNKTTKSMTGNGIEVYMTKEYGMSYRDLYSFKSNNYIYMLSSHSSDEARNIVRQILSTLELDQI